MITSPHYKTGKMSSQFTKETNFCEQENITLKEWKQVKFLIWWSSGPRDNIAKQDQRFWLLDLGICNKLVWNIPDMGPVMFQNICNIYTYTHTYIYIYVCVCVPFHRERESTCYIYSNTWRPCRLKIKTIRTRAFRP